MARYDQTTKDAALEAFTAGFGLGTVAQKVGVPKSAVRSFVASAKIKTAGRKDLPEKQHKARPAEKQLVALAETGAKGSVIAKTFGLPFRTAVAAAWRFGRPKAWDRKYQPLATA